MVTRKKNQHYIPKFYLRNFSFQKNGNQIGVFHLKSRFFHQTAKLKTQGSKNFFYGQSGEIEDHLANIEGYLSTSIREILTSKKLPARYSDGHVDLLTFVILTNQRNPAFIQHIKNTQNAIRNHILEVDKDANLDEVLPLMNHEEVVQMAMSGLKDHIYTISDLNYKLLLNKTKVPFITSDFPVIKYNRFLENRKWPHGKSGYAQIGLKIMIPLDPWTLIIFYDPMIYQVGKKNRSFHKIASTDDVNKLNQLQIVNCLETIYFNEHVSKDYILSLAKSCDNYKRANEIRSEFTHLLEKGQDPKSLDESTRNFMIIGSSDCETQFHIGGITMTNYSKHLELSPTMAQLRPSAMLNDGPSNSI